MASNSAHWLSAEDWRKAQRSLPILCVEVLALRRQDGNIKEIGLIRRDTPHQGLRWCLIGGRMRYGELIAEAVAREIREALGEGVAYAPGGADEPLKIVQYMPSEDKGEYHDPRQHAVSLVFAVEISGTPSPQGEALAFAWFAPDALPGTDGIGFGKRRAIDDCLRRLGIVS